MKTKTILIAILLACSTQLSFGQSYRWEYEIETSHNDELFIINGEKYEAKTYCFDMEEGDRVIFLDGSPYGVCVSATLLNLRTRNKCEVWCA